MHTPLLNSEPYCKLCKDLIRSHPITSRLPALQPSSISWFSIALMRPMNVHHFNTDDEVNNKECA